MPELILRLALPDRSPVSLRLAKDSTVLALGEVTVSSWDLAGRPYALVRESGTYRRGLDGGLLHKREATAGEPRVRERLSALQGSGVIEAARREAEGVLEVVEQTASGQPPREAAVRRLRTIVSMDALALARDAERFLEASGPVGILPPDQYLALVVRLTEGCSWNQCTFCSLYREIPFRVKSPEQLTRHLADLQRYFGPSIVLRRSIFLGDANALCLAQEQLLPRLRRVRETFPRLAFHGFVDAWTGHRRTAGEWRELARLGLRRVYVGLETGHPDLLAWLGKAGHPDDAILLVRELHSAGISAGVIVLLGAGGLRFETGHLVDTVAALDRMELRASDLLFFSEFVDAPDHGSRAAGDAALAPLDDTGCARQRAAILTALGTGARRGPRAASYDLREFVY